jgi:hypothetical protein
MTQVHRTADSQIAAMRAALSAGHPEIVFMILDGTARVYTRTPRSKCGWQISDWDRPYPEGTAAVILRDVYDGPEVFYVLPIKAIKTIIRKDGPGVGLARDPRPVTPESRHMYIRPERVASYRAWTPAMGDPAGYRDCWAFYAA